MSQQLLSTAIDLFLNPKMGDYPYPAFLDHKSKWLEWVEKTKTIPQFEEVFYKMMEDKDMSTENVLKVMKEFEKDVIECHGNELIYCVMEVVEAIMRYMLFRNQDCEIAKAKEEQQARESSRVTCDCFAGCQ